MFCSCVTFAQQKTEKLEKAVAIFYKALVAKDTAALKEICDDKIVYGHSNGWNQNKKQLVDDLYNGKLNYNVIERSGTEVVIDKNTGCVREKIDVKIVMGDEALNFNLYALTVWVYKKGKWKLLSRQAIKL